MHISDRVLMNERELRRFYARLMVDRDSGCWNWDRPHSASTGYGAFTIERKIQYAHRVSYATFVGPLEVGLHIDHLCRNRLCVNPDHLEQVPVRVNVLRGIGPTAANARRTHCKRGHEFTPENTRVDKRGQRCCKACARKRSNTEYATKRGGLVRPIRRRYNDA